MLATVSTLTKCPVLDMADDDEERERGRASVSSVHSPRHLAQTGNTDGRGRRKEETSKWASVTETNLQTVKFIRGLALLFRVHSISSLQTPWYLQGGASQRRKNYYIGTTIL